MLPKPKRALVDVDGILWDFHNPLRRYLRTHARAPDMLPTHWDWYQDVGVSDKDFSEGITAVHHSQTSFPAGYPPFAGARQMLEKFQRLGYETIIASHRRVGTADQLARWLLYWRLEPFAGVYCGRNKHFLIDPRQGVVVDDAPMTIIEGALAGCHVLTLAYPWNESEKVGGGMYDDIYTRCADLAELTRLLR